MGTANICLGEAFPEAPPVPGLCPASPARRSQLAELHLGQLWGLEHRELQLEMLRSHRMPSIKANPTGNSCLGILWTSLLVISDDVLEELAYGPL